MSARTYIAGDPEAMNAVHERQKRTGLNLSEILASMKEIKAPHWDAENSGTILTSHIADTSFDIDNYGNGVGPSMTCPACGTTALTVVASHGYDGVKLLECSECGQERWRETR